MIIRSVVFDAPGHYFPPVWTTKKMANLEQMSRVLYSHVWDDVRQWVTAVERLADLGDNELSLLTTSDGPDHYTPAGELSVGQPRSE